MRKIKLQKYLKLINKYQTILNKKNNTVSKKRNIELVDLIAKLLEIIII